MAAHGGGIPHSKTYWTYVEWPHMESESAVARYRSTSGMSDMLAGGVTELPMLFSWDACNKGQPGNLQHVKVTFNLNKTPANLQLDKLGRESNAAQQALCSP